MGGERLLSCLIAMTSFSRSDDGRATTLTAGGLDLDTGFFNPGRRQSWDLAANRAPGLFCLKIHPLLGPKAEATR